MPMTRLVAVGSRRVMAERGDMAGARARRARVLGGPSSSGRAEGGREWVGGREEAREERKRRGMQVLQSWSCCKRPQRRRQENGRALHLSSSHERPICLHVSSFSASARLLKTRQGSLRKRRVGKEGWAE